MAAIPAKAEWLIEKSPLERSNRSNRTDIVAWPLGPLAGIAGRMAKGFTDPREIVAGPDIAIEAMHADEEVAGDQRLAAMAAMAIRRDWRYVSAPTQLTSHEPKITTGLDSRQGRNA